jgi:predicted 3-demethylubiquinone-9 3-methyltransferase (glyoxalase superfamily)
MQVRLTSAAADNPSTPQVAVLVVEFTVAGRPFIGLNGDSAALTSGQREVAVTSLDGTLSPSTLTAVTQ